MFHPDVGIGRNGKTVGDLRHYILAVFCQCIALGLRSIIVFDELRTRTEDSQSEYDDKHHCIVEGSLPHRKFQSLASQLDD